MYTSFQKDPSEYRSIITSTEEKNSNETESSLIRKKVEAPILFLMALLNSKSMESLTSLNPSDSGFQKLSHLLQASLPFSYVKISKLRVQGDGIILPQESIYCLILRLVSQKMIYRSIFYYLKNGTQWCRYRIFEIYTRSCKTPSPRTQGKNSTKKKQCLLLVGWDLTLF